MTQPRAPIPASVHGKKPRPPGGRSTGIAVLGLIALLLYGLAIAGNVSPAAHPAWQSGLPAGLVTIDE